MNILNIDYSFQFKKKEDLILLYFDIRNASVKDINIPFLYEWARTVGGGDYVYRIAYSTKNFFEYDYYKFNSDKIFLRIDNNIDNKTFQCNNIIVDWQEGNLNHFNNCKFICNKLYLSGKMNSAEFTKCDFSETNIITI